MSNPTPTRELFGLLAEFRGPRDIVAGARLLTEKGYLKVEGYTPYPMEDLSEALELPRSVLPKLVLVGGIVGCLLGYSLEYWASVIAFPLNVGGRPFHSWPAFIVPAFETTILFAAGTAVVGMLALNGLPQPYHPVFNVAAFAKASRDGFFLSVEASDPKFDRAGTRKVLESLPGVVQVSEIEP